MTLEQIQRIHSLAFKKLARMYYTAGRERWPVFNLVIEDQQELFNELDRVETKAFHGQATEKEVRAAISNYWEAIKAGFEEYKCDKWTRFGWNEAIRKKEDTT